MKSLQQSQIQVDFIGDGEYLLCTVFTWLQRADDNISVHLCQLKFTEFSAHRFLVHTENKVPNITPYRFGFPINSISTVDLLYPDLPRQKQVYQIIVVCINWLDTCTRPDIAPALPVIASFINASHT